VYHLKIDHLLYATSYNFSPTLLGYFLSFVFCFPPCGLLETFYYNTLTQFCMDNLSLSIGMHVVSDSFEKIKETVQLLFYPSFCLSWLRRHGHKLMITR
jgi:hypothetical protein